MDHKREICCLNNDYLLYLANVKRGKYNSSVTQHEKVNGWELRAEFTLRKSQLSYESEIMLPAQKTKFLNVPISSYVFTNSIGGPCCRLDSLKVIILRWNGGAWCMSGINYCERKGKKIQDWAEKETKLVCKRDRAPARPAAGLWRWYGPWHCFGSPLFCGRIWNAQGRAAHSLSAAEDIIASADLKTLY